MFLILVFSAVASYKQVFVVCTWVFPKVAFLWRGGGYIEKNELADSSQSFSSRVSTSKESVIQCRISTNYEQPRQSVVESQRIKSCWKSRAASNSSYIFLERDPCLRRATKIVVTEVGQVRQTITTEIGDHYVGHRSGSSFRGRNKHQTIHRDNADGGRLAKTTASGNSKARTAFRRNCGEEADRLQQVHHTNTIHHKNSSVLKWQPDHLGAEGR